MGGAGVLPHAHTILDPDFTHAPHESQQALPLPRRRPALSEIQVGDAGLSRRTTQASQQGKDARLGGRAGAPRPRSVSAAAVGAGVQHPAPARGGGGLTRGRVASSSMRPESGEEVEGVEGYMA